MPLTSLCKINKPIASLCHIVTYLTRYSDMPFSVTTFLQSPSKNTILPFTHSHPYLSSTTSTAYEDSITASILPPRPPPLLPLPAIKLLLSQLPINLIMRLTHPFPKLVSTLRPHLILRHPDLEIGRADPAWI